MTEKFLRKDDPSDREVEQAILALKKGAHLLKCGRRGKPKLCPFMLSTDEKSLIWYSGEKERHLKLHAVSKVILGQQTVNFLRHNQGEKDIRSFSLVYENGQRSLDLICKDKEQAESWYRGLKALISASCHIKPLTYLRGGRGAHSCASSPVGCISVKHELRVFQGSAKLAKVRSLYGSPARSMLDRHFSGRMLYSSDEYYSPRQRTLSDAQTYMDKFLPPIPHVVSDSEKEMRNSNLSKEQRIIHVYKVCSSDKRSNVDLKDIFIWGKEIGGISGGGLNSLKNKCLKADSLLPKLMDLSCMLDVQSISCGENHAALVTKQGEVFCWGEGNGGRLGHKISMDAPYPKVVESLTCLPVMTVACGAKHTCAITNSGEFYVWGDSSHGLGNLADWCNSSQWFPHRISGPLNGIHVSKVSCGEWHTAIVSSSGQLFTYGDGTFGVLGHGDVQSTSLPKEVESLKGLRVKSVACGPWHTAAIVEILIDQVKSNTPAGKLFTWGDNDKGRLGHADKKRKLLPTCVSSLVDRDFVQVSCGTMLTVALTVTGVVYTMGSSRYGQLGNPNAEDFSIATVEGLLTKEFVKDIASGSFHVAVLTVKGKIYTWGKGENGQLGLGDNKDRNSPALVEALEDRHVESVACGSSFTVVTCLHRFISSKDQSICSGCRLSFGFSRKKHNCYNCGHIFCHSCSSRKASNASLAPNKNKKFRVCDSCFTQLKTIADSRINPELASPRLPQLLTPRGYSDLIKKGQNFLAGAKPFFSRLSAIEEFKLFEENADSMLEKGQNNQHSCPSFYVTTQRWGQVQRPWQFMEHARESSSKILPVSKEELCPVGHTDAQHSSVDSKPVLPNSAGLKRELSKVDKILIEELCRLKNEAITLTQQCQSKSLKLHQYKRRVEETWSLAKDEAAKCKAAKDVIKILTNQINALSEKLSARRQISNIESNVDVTSMLQPTQKKLLQPEMLPSCSGNEPDNAQILERENNGICSVSETIKHQRRVGSFNKTLLGDTDTRKCSSKAFRDEWVEQNEAGVYITFITLPSGQKGIKRVRFSRKYFSKKEAERWWQENQRRIYKKYSIERIVTPAISKPGQ